MSDEFTKFVKWAGSFVIAIAFVSIPILTTCSFIYGWYGLVKTVLLLLTMLEALFVACAIFDNTF